MTLTYLDQCFSGGTPEYATQRLQTKCSTQEGLFDKSQQAASRPAIICKEQWSRTPRCGAENTLQGCASLMLACLHEMLPQQWHSTLHLSIGKKISQARKDMQVSGSRPSFHSTSSTMPASPRNAVLLFPRLLCSRCPMHLCLLGSRA